MKSPSVLFIIGALAGIAIIAVSRHAQAKEDEERETLAKLLKVLDNERTK